MKKCLCLCLFLFLLLLGVTLAGCSGLSQPTASNNQTETLAAENRQLEEEYAQLLERVEELEDAFKTTGFLEPQVLVEPAIVAPSSDTLQQVLNRGRLYCGINIDAPGLGYLDATSGQVAGFDIDFCRAIAAAVFGTQGARQVDMKALTNRTRFAALQSGEVDLLVRNTTWTISRDTTMGIDFAGPLLYDGIGVLAPIDRRLTSPRDLAGETVCVISGSTAEALLEAYFAFFDEKIDISIYADAASARNAYESAECNGLADDTTSLIGQRMLLAEPENHTILAGEMSREPLAPAVRQDDSTWRDIVNWVVQCTINAEHLGVNQRNVASQRDTDNQSIRWLLGVDGDAGAGLGLAPDFCYQVLLQVGNYADIYGRNLGPASPYDLPRGLNALYTDGGLLYPLPFR